MSKPERITSIPHTMRHARRGARWAVARFDNGEFALYWRDVNGVWRSRTAAPACLETVGQPSCPCGETLQPTELELAFILGAEDSRPMVEYLRKCNSVAKGQAGPGSAHLADTSHYESPEEQAAKFVEKSRRQSARARRLAALLPAPQPMPF
jgi:hypothetical protein